MSTRSTIVLAEAEGVAAHLYDETNDGTVHLEVDMADERTPGGINVVIPRMLVAGLAAMLRKSEDRG